MADEARDKQSMGTNISLAAGSPSSPYQLTYARPQDGMPGSIVTGTGADWFGPLNPMFPTAPIDVKGRILDYPSGYNLQIRPRSYENISYEMLRNFADSYDLLRILIETRKDQMARLDWNLAPRDKKMKRRGGSIPAEMQARADKIIAFFLMPDQENFWSDWLRILLEDLFVIDAPTIYRRMTYGGELYALQAIDGGTIKRVIDDFGNTPQVPTPAYQQVLKGYPAVDYTTDELIWRPRNKRTHKIYGYSPVEQIIMTINIGMRRQTWQLQSFTDGNIPEALIGTPAQWTPDQVRQFQDWFDSMLEGNTGQRRKARFVPGDVAKGYVPTKPAEIFGEGEEWLIRVMCFAFNISPQPFVKMMNRATAETAQETAASDGLAPIQDWVKGLMDFMLIKDFDSPDLEFVWQEEDELDPNIKSQIVDREQAAGRLTYNEARREQGLDPDPHPDADRAMFKSATGWTPIFLTPEETEAKQAVSNAISGLDPDGNPLPPKPDDEEGPDGTDEGGGPPKPPGAGGGGSDTPPGGDEGVAEKSDLPFPHVHGPGCSHGGLAKAGKASNTKADNLATDPLRPKAAKIEKRLARGMSAMLSRLAVTVATQVKAKLNAVARDEAVEKTDYPDDFDIDELLRDLNLDTIMSTQDDLQSAMEEIGKDTGRVALSQIGQLAEDPDLVERVNQRALVWATDRAAELVGLGDGDFDLMQTTRDMIRSTIADGIANNLSTDEIGDALEDAYAFSDDRAQLIAATEITSANSEGALAGYQEASSAGVNVMKSWLVLEDGCDICQENADAGAIELDDDFPSGDSAPGAHPNCRCVLVPVVIDEDGNETEDDDADVGGDALELADNPSKQPRSRRGRFTRDPGESFMSAMAPGVPGVKAKVGHVVTELAVDVEDVAPEDDTTVAEKVAKGEGLASEADMTQRSSLYVARQLFNADEFLKWAKEQGFEFTLKPDDLHVTQMFSRDPVDWADITPALDFLTVPEDGFRAVQALGDKGAVVLRFECQELTDRWQVLRDIGASWDYEGYHPHVSITYKGGGIRLEDIIPYTGRLEFGPEIYRRVVEDWDTKIEEEG